MNPKRVEEPDSARYCPECAQPLAPGKEDAHAELHWPRDTPPNRISREAIERRDKVKAGGVRKDQLA